MPESLLDIPLREFLRKLASSEPAPGGGAAAGVAGALAAALASMVCELTRGRPRFAAVEPRIAELSRELERARALLETLIDEDAAAYAELSAAFKLPREDATRAERIRSCAAVAAAVPLEIVAAARIVRREACELRDIGNPNLRSDAQCAVSLAEAAMHAAAENVRANLPYMADAASLRISAELSQLIEDRG